MFGPMTQFFLHEYVYQDENRALMRLDIIIIIINARPARDCFVAC
jgi:hypothetical protein